MVVLHTTYPRGTHKWFGGSRSVSQITGHRKMLINFEPLKLEKCLGLLFRMTISGRLVVGGKTIKINGLYYMKWKEAPSPSALCGLGIPSTGFHKTLCGLKSSFPALRSVREWEKYNKRAGAILLQTWIAALMMMLLHFSTFGTHFFSFLAQTKGRNSRHGLSFSWVSE